MSKQYKIIIAHPAQQHSYQLATALKKQGAEVKYITTVYNKPKSLTHFITKLLGGDNRKRAEGRKCSCLDDDVLLMCEGEGLIKLLLSKVPKLSKQYVKVKYRVADRFAKKVARYALKNDVDVVITYDDCSPLLFEILKERKPQVVRILDVSAANREYMKTVYERDFLLQPFYKEMLQKECSNIWDKRLGGRSKRELNSAQYFLSPSSFVTRSLEFSGIKEDQILFCPYGIDSLQFSKKISKQDDGPINFIYVGGVKELKGVSYLIEAFSRFSEEQALLTIVGECRTKVEVSKNVRFTGLVLHSQIPNLLCQSDVFIFPSLGDSFGFSVLEAAACGLPLVVSENTGMADFIKEGENGFVIPIQSADAIYNKINWFISNKNKIKEMGEKATEIARMLSWNQYYERCNQIIKVLRNKI